MGCLLLYPLIAQQYTLPVKSLQLYLIRSVWTKEMKSQIKIDLSQEKFSSGRIDDWKWSKIRFETNYLIRFKFTFFRM